MGDFDGDGTNNVAFSQSERAGYAVAWYRSTSPNGAGPWTKQHVAVVDYCHSLHPPGDSAACVFGHGVYIALGWAANLLRPLITRR